MRQSATPANELRIFPPYSPRHLPARRAGSRRILLGESMPQISRRSFIETSSRVSAVGLLSACARVTPPAGPPKHNTSESSLTGDFGVSPQALTRALEVVSAVSRGTGSFVFQVGNGFRIRTQLDTTHTSQWHERGIHVRAPLPNGRVLFHAHHKCDDETLLRLVESLPKPDTDPPPLTLVPGTTSTSRVPSLSLAFASAGCALVTDLLRPHLSDTSLVNVEVEKQEIATLHVAADGAIHRHAMDASRVSVSMERPSGSQRTRLAFALPGDALADGDALSAWADTIRSVIEQSRDSRPAPNGATQVVFRPNAAGPLLAAQFDPAESHSPIRQPLALDPSAPTEILDEAGPYALPDLRPTPDSHLLPLRLLTWNHAPQRCRRHLVVRPRGGRKATNTAESVEKLLSRGIIIDAISPYVTRLDNGDFRVVVSRGTWKDGATAVPVSPGTPVRISGRWLSAPDLILGDDAVDDLTAWARQGTVVASLAHPTIFLQSAEVLRHG